MKPQALREALLRAGVGVEEPAQPAFTKAELYTLGLTGTPDARCRRLALQRALDLPANLSTNALLGVLNAITTPAVVEELISRCAAGEEEL